MICDIFKVNQDQAIKFITGLIPDIKAAGNPIPVLLKVASKASLAPAQLEKVGMVYNNILALTHLKKSATDERGGSFPLLDVASLVEQYKTSRNDFVGSGGVEKQASASRENIVAGSSWPTHATFAKPSIFEDIHKQASTTIRPMPQPAQQEQVSLGKMMNLLDMTKRAAEETEQVVFEIVPEINNRVRSLMRKYSSGNTFSEVCEDMNILGLEEVRPALDLLALKFHKEASGVKYWDGNASRFLVSDRHSAQSDLVSLSSLIRTLGEAQDTASELRKQSSELEDIVFVKEAGAQRQPKNDPKGGYAPQNKRGPNRSPASQGSSAEKFFQDMKFSPSGSFAESQLQQSTQQPVVLLDNASLLSEIPKELAEVQNAWDKKILERKRMANLSRVMIQDPIVSTADPVDVMEIYNNIIPLEPNIADKPMLMAQTMRTAIQQQTIDPHELKTILEIEKSNLQTNELLSKEIDARSLKVDKSKPPAKKKY